MGWGGDGFSFVHVGEFDFVWGVDLDEELCVLGVGVFAEFAWVCCGFVGDAGVEWGDLVAVSVPGFAVGVVEVGFGFLTAS